MNITTNRTIVFSAVSRLAVISIFLGVLVGHGFAQETNLDFQALAAAADKGDSQAQFKLAEDYAKGIGPAVGLSKPKQLAKAAEYLKKAADQGYAPAEVELGSLYGRGRGVPRNIALAVQWYRKAAEQGDALAQYAMGGFYSVGRGVTNDVTQAIEWWKKAVAQNQADAENALGQLYLLPTPEHGTNYLNYAEAERLFRLAAAQGSATAYNNLGVIYENGLGEKYDFKEAAKWYRMAAEQGDALAQANLGQLYFDGRGVPFNLVEAYKWFKLSANQGNNLGMVGIGHYQTHPLLKPEETAAAEKMVREFKPQPPIKML